MYFHMELRQKEGAAVSPTLKTKGQPTLQQQRGETPSGARSRWIGFGKCLPDGDYDLVSHIDGVHRHGRQWQCVYNGAFRGDDGYAPIGPFVPWDRRVEEA